MGISVRVLAACGLVLLVGERAPAQGLLWTHGAECASPSATCDVGHLGTAVANAGDVNGDGFDDVVAGAPYAGTATAPVTPVGRALILSGQSGALIAAVVGSSPGDQLGRAVGGAGDVDADGRADVIVGAPGSDLSGSGAGAALVLSGSGAVLLTLTGNSAEDGFGSAVSGAGDVNADGHADLIVGAPLDDPHGPSSGSALVVSGADGSVLFQLQGSVAYANFGASVAGAGDVDHDGHADVLVGAPWEPSGGQSAGAAHLYSGATGTLLQSWHGGASGDQFGVSVAGAGDVDADGTDDVLVGARMDDSNAVNAGAAFVFSGADGELLRALHGAAPNDLFGTSVSGAGDMDEDGHADLVVGAPSVDVDGVASGAAYVLSGATGETLLSFHGEEGDSFGQAVAGGGDGDGNGLPDVVIGVPDGEASFFVDVGVVVAYSGVPWVNMGLSLEGAQGSSLLSGTGKLQGNDPVTLTLSGAAPLAPSMLVLGLTAINASLKGSVLVPHPDVVSVAQATDAGGALQLQGLYPGGLPAGMQFVLQFWTLDDASVSGFSASNGLSATVP